MLTPALAEYWGVEALGPIRGKSPHAEALLAEPEWWEGLENVVKFIGTTAGQWESLYDDIVAWDKKVGERSRVRKELRVGHREIHDAPLFDFDAGRKPAGSSEAACSWIKAAFS